MEPIVHWLEGLGLSQYREAFVEAEIDVEVLPDLNEADLEKLGLSLVIARSCCAPSQTYLDLTLPCSPALLVPRRCRQSGRKPNGAS